MSKELEVFEKIKLYDLKVTIKPDEFNDTMVDFRIDKDNYHFLQRMPYENIHKNPDKVFEILSDIIDNFLEDMDRC